jgi:hypothetical protein
LGNWLCEIAVFGTFLPCEDNTRHVGPCKQYNPVRMIKLEKSGMQTRISQEAGET